MTSGKNSKGSEEERNNRRLETDGREETGGTGQYGYGVRRPGKSVRHSNQRDGNGHGDAAVDGSTTTCPQA